MQTERAWRIVGSSVRGVSHLKSDLPCQDAHQWQTPEPGFLLAAAADGAGSARESQIGARIACRAAIDFLSRELKPVSPDFLPALREATNLARAAVLAESARMNLAPRELACTLILLAAAPGRAAAAQIGDGAALVLTAAPELRALTLPIESEYLNETQFLTSDHALEQMQACAIDSSIRGVAMFTDGLQMLALKMPERIPHQPFFDPLFRFVEKEPDPRVRLEQIEKLLLSPRITQRADDDLTLLLGLLL